MRVRERLLQRVSSPSDASPSTVVDRRPVGLDREQHAALHRHAVEVHGAGAAVAGVAADVGAGQLAVVAEEVHEQPRRRDLPLVPSSPLISTEIRRLLVGSATSAPRSLGGLQDGADSGDLGERAAVVGRRVDVRGRVERSAEALGRRADRRLGVDRRRRGAPPSPSRGPASPRRSRARSRTPSLPTVAAA